MIFPKNKSLLIVTVLSFFTYNICLALPAFPGAVGAGTETNHGRWGRVIPVTNLNNSGYGSLRNALEASGRRIVVFKVGGTIKLNSPIIIRHNNILVAGQTAPGDGITIRGRKIVIAGSDVVIRHIRFRPDGWVQGDDEQTDGIEIFPNYPYSPYRSQAKNIVIDHCSLSWASDENVSTNGIVKDTTFSRNIISEGLHQTRGSGRGIILSPKAERISMHHNLFAHNPIRNPLSRGATSFDFVNNVIYNWRYEGLGFLNGWSGYSHNRTSANVVGNYFKKGQNIADPEIRVSSKLPDGSKIYVKGNIGPRRLNDSENEWKITSENGKWYSTANKKYRSSSRINLPYVAATSASAAYEDVLKNVGANLPKIDSTDSRIINDVRRSRGKILFKDVGEVGGYPNFEGASAPRDSDFDGMPDYWEVERGLNPNNSSDATRDLYGNGYTNIEYYLNSSDKGSYTASSSNFAASTVVASSAVVVKSADIKLHEKGKFSGKGEIPASHFLLENLVLKESVIGKYAKFARSSIKRGSLYLKNTGGSGSYDIGLTFLDENDGDNRYNLRINGRFITTWRGNRNNGNFRTVWANDVNIPKGGWIEVAVTRGGAGGEAARMTKITLK